MEPREDVISEPDGSKTHLFRVDGGVHEYLGIEVVFSQVKLNLDFCQSFPLCGKPFASYVFRESAKSCLLSQNIHMIAENARQIPLHM